MEVLILGIVAGFALGASCALVFMTPLIKNDRKTIEELEDALSIYEDEEARKSIKEFLSK